MVEEGEDWQNVQVPAETAGAPAETPAPAAAPAAPAAGATKPVEHTVVPGAKHQ